MGEWIWIGIAAFAAGAAVGAAAAWVLRGAREKAAGAGVEAQLQSVQEQLARRSSELEAARAKIEVSADLLRAESGARAAAEEKAARVAALEASQLPRPSSPTVTGLRALGNPQPSLDGVA